MEEPTWPAPFPQPVPRLSDEPFWDGIQARRMALQECGFCGHVRYPSAELCPKCLSDGVEWNEVSGQAELVTWCTFHRHYLPAFPPPHTVAVGHLSEGPFFVAMLLDGAPEDGASGSPLRVTYVADPEGRVLPAFRLTDVEDRT